MSGHEATSHLGGDGPSTSPTAITTEPAWGSSIRHHRDGGGLAGSVGPQQPYVSPLDVEVDTVDGRAVADSAATRPGR